MQTLAVSACGLHDGNIPLLGDAGASDDEKDAGDADGSADGDGHEADIVVVVDDDDDGNDGGQKDCDGAGCDDDDDDGDDDDDCDYTMMIWRCGTLLSTKQQRMPLLLVVRA